MSDIHFDHKSDKFASNIYGTFKGELRLSLIEQALEPVLTHAPLRILDIGAGSGQLSERLLKAGHHVTLVEPSLPMLDELVSRLNAQQNPQAVLINSDLQTFEPQQDFDLILCHAVLEWLETPLETACRLFNWLAPTGHLSLAYYNRNALTFRHLLYGNFTPPEARKRRNRKKSLTPISPLIPEDIDAWLMTHGFEIEDKVGIRTFSDYMPEHIKQQVDPAQLTLWETKMARRSPYRELARYIHILATRNTTP